jgi:hypothetical protein
MNHSAYLIILILEKHLPGGHDQRTHGHVTLHRSGLLEDVRKTGIFLTVKKETAEQYSDSAVGGKYRQLREYVIDDDLNLKIAENRWALLKELDPKWDQRETENRLIKQSLRDKKTWDKPYPWPSGSQRIQTYVEKRIKQLLSKQGYDGVKYVGDNITDQEGEYQIFDPKKIGFVGEQ